MWGFAYLRPKFEPPWGGPYGSLGYESKCWVGFNFRFDVLMNDIGVNK